MKQRVNKSEEKVAEQKRSYYNEADFDHFDQKPYVPSPVVQQQVVNTVPETPVVKSYKEPDRKFRRNVTLSEELFRCLEFIKKNKNKTKAQGEGLITIDKIMFDMVQFCVDNQYPETKVMFEKYLKLKEMGGFDDLM